MSSDPSKKGRQNDNTKQWQRQRERQLYQKQSQNSRERKNITNDKTTTKNNKKSNRNVSFTPSLQNRNNKQKYGYENSNGNNNRQQRQKFINGSSFHYNNRPPPPLYEDQCLQMLSMSSSQNELNQYDPFESPPNFIKAERHHQATLVGWPRAYQMDRNKQVQQYQKNGKQQEWQKGYQGRNEKQGMRYKNNKNKGFKDGDQDLNKKLLQSNFSHNNKKEQENLRYETLEQQQQEIQICPCCQNVINKIPIPLCCRDKDLLFLGVGYSLYYKLAKYIFCILLLIFVLSGSVFDFLRTLNGECRGDGGIVVQVEGGVDIEGGYQKVENSGIKCLDFLGFLKIVNYDHLLEQKGNEGPEKEQVQNMQINAFSADDITKVQQSQSVNTDSLKEQSESQLTSPPTTPATSSSSSIQILNMITAIGIFGFVIYFKSHLNREIISLEQQVICPSQYTLMVQHLPKTYEESELRKWAIELAKDGVRMRDRERQKEEDRKVQQQSNDKNSNNKGGEVVQSKSYYTNQYLQQDEEQNNDSQPVLINIGYDITQLEEAYKNRNSLTIKLNKILIQQQQRESIMGGGGSSTATIPPGGVSQSWMSKNNHLSYSTRQTHNQNHNHNHKDSYAREMMNDQSQESKEYTIRMQIEKYDKIIESYKNNNIECQKNGTAFITYNNAEIVEMILQKHQKTFYSTLFVSALSNIMSSKKVLQFQGRSVLINRAPAPRQVIWENLTYSYFRNIAFQICFLTLMIGLILMAFNYQFQFASYAYTLRKQGKESGKTIIILQAIVMSLIVVGLNSLLRIIMTECMQILIFTKLKHYHSHTAEQSSFCLYYSLMYIFNTCFMPYIVHGQYIETTNQLLLYDIHFIMLANAFSEPLFKLCDPMMWYKIVKKNYVRSLGGRNVLEGGKNKNPYTQMYVNRLYEGHEVSNGDNYQYLTRILFVTVWYAHAAPLGVVFSLIGLTTDYWIAKILLLRVYKRPENISKSIASVILNSLQLLPLIYICGVLQFQYKVSQTSNIVDFLWNFLQYSVIISVLFISLIGYFLFFKTNDIVIPQTEYKRMQSYFIWNYETQNPITKYIGEINYLNGILKGEFSSGRGNGNVNGKVRSGKQKDRELISQLIGLSRVSMVGLEKNRADIGKLKMKMLLRRRLEEDEQEGDSVTGSGSGGGGGAYGGGEGEIRRSSQFEDEGGKKYIEMADMSKNEQQEKNALNHNNNRSRRRGHKGRKSRRGTNEQYGRNYRNENGQVSSSSSDDEVSGLGKGMMKMGGSNYATAKNNRKFKIKRKGSIFS